MIAAFNVPKSLPAIHSQDIGDNDWIKLVLMVKLFVNKSEDVVVLGPVCVLLFPPEKAALALEVKRH